jgi:capsular polysaccharide biosynthesis protein
MVGSLLCALLVILFAELASRRVRTALDLERDHGLPVLGELTGTPLWMGA